MPKITQRNKCEQHYTVNHFKSFSFHFHFTYIAVIKTSADQSDFMGGKNQWAYFFLSHFFIYSLNKLKIVEDRFLENRLFYSQRVSLCNSYFATVTYFDLAVVTY